MTTATSRRWTARRPTVERKEGEISTTIPTPRVLSPPGDDQPKLRRPPSWRSSNGDAPSTKSPPPLDRVPSWRKSQDKSPPTLEPLEPKKRKSSAALMGEELA